MRNNHLYNSKFVYYEFWFVLAFSCFSPCFQTLMNYDGISGIFRPDVRPIAWFEAWRLPENEPFCGFHNEKLICLAEGWEVIALITG